MKSHLVFAYGSNMNPRQMQSRCPGAEALCAATLDGYRLAFVGNSSSWGGGVATIEPARRSSVAGFLWMISGANLQRLDAFEGFPSVYDREYVKVDLGDGQLVWCWTYIHNADAGRHSKPSALYLRTILDGYDWAGMSPSPALRRMFRAAIVAEATRA